MENKNNIKNLLQWIIWAVIALFFIGVFIIPKNLYDNILRSNTNNKINELIVKFKGIEEISVIKIADPNDLKKIRLSYEKNQDVLYIEPNYNFKAAIIPTDSYYTNQWYLKKINAQEAWNTIRESSHVIVAVIDSGVQITHPDLQDNIWINNKEIIGNKIDDDKNGFIDDVNGWDFVNNVSDPSPKFSEGFTEAGVMHGTIVAGVIGASGNNAAGITGVTWKAQIMPLKVLNDAGEGDTAKVVSAIDYAIKNGADIINLSFVGFGYSQALEESIGRAYDAGVIVVAAAGNEQADGTGYDLNKTPMYPACHDGSSGQNYIIGVAATDTLDQKASFSSYGTKCIDLSAPGISIYSTAIYDPSKRIDNKVFNKYYDGFWSGTSMAAPMVSGALALIKELNPRLTSDELTSVILNNSDNINKLNPNYIGLLGKGRLNIKSSVDFVQQTVNNNTVKLLFSPLSVIEGSSTISVSNINGKQETSFEPFPKLKGGINMVSGDLDGDGLLEIVASPRQGNSPFIKIFDAKYNFKNQFLAFDVKFKGGVNLAVADVNRDGKKEIIVAPVSNGGPHIKIFNFDGKLLSQFFAYDKKYIGGVNIASGDVDGDGAAEIITGTEKGGGPQVRIFKMNGKVVNQFFAYETSFRGGVRVAVADISKGNRGNIFKIITSPGLGGGPYVKIFGVKGGLEGQFLAYSKNFRGGVSIAAGDLDNNGFDEIVTGAGPGGTPHLRVFTSQGVLIGSFYAYEEKYNGGINVSILTK